MELTHEILERLEKLEDKYAVMGQDILSYLDGLICIYLGLRLSG